MIFKNFKLSNLESIVPFIFIWIVFGSFFSGILGTMDGSEFNIIGYGILAFVFSIFFFIGEEKEDKRRGFLLLILGGLFFVDSSLLALWMIPFFIVILELLFFADKEKPKKKQSKFTFTIKKKFEALIETIIIIEVVLLLIQLLEGLVPFVIKMIKLSIEKMDVIFNFLLQVAQYIGILIAVGLVLWGYIKLNSLKYKK